VRVGLDTGLVVAAEVADGLGLGYTAIGDPANVAARMQQLARPGTVWATGATRRAGGDAFSWRPRGTRALKGRRGRVQAFELLGQQAGARRFDRLARRELTRFIGRDRELDQLLAAWGTAQQGQGQVVSVVGEAGIGKSRLVHEFKQRLAPVGVPIVEGSCFAYGETTPYLSFLDIVRALVGLAEAESEPAAKRRLEQHLGLLGPDVAPVAPYLLRLLGLPAEDAGLDRLAPEIVRQRTVGALVQLVRAEAGRRPLVLIVEDVHWIDEASEEVVRALIETTRSAPLALVLLHRPDYRPDWLAAGCTRRLGLLPLAAQGSEDLVRAVARKAQLARVPPPPLPPTTGTAMVRELEQLVVARAEGNPLFIEELTRSLVEAGAGDRDTGRGQTPSLEPPTVPATLQGVLLARIDGLAAGPRDVLQIASVVGRLFSSRLLTQVAEVGADVEWNLALLENLEFVYPTGLGPERDYSFKHVLVQEAVYQTLLRSTREAHHERIAQVLEASQAYALEEFAELLAHHYALSGNKDKAVEHLIRANRRAARLHAVEAAEAHFDAALAILGQLPETEANQRRTLALLADQGWVMDALLKHPEYYELLCRYRPAAVELGDPGLLGRLAARMGWCEMTFLDLDRAEQTLQDAARLCEAAGADDEAAQAYTHLLFACVGRGEFDRALAVHRDVARLLARRFDPRWYVFSAAAVLLGHVWRGRWEAAEAQAQEALRTGRSAENDSLISFAAWTLSVVCTAKGDLGQAIEYGRLAVEKAPTPGDRAWAEPALAWARARAGEPRAGAEVLARVVPLMRAVRFFFVSEQYALWLGEAYALVGEDEAAIRTLAETLALTEPARMRFLLGSAHRLLGELAMRASGGLAAGGSATDHFEQSLSLLTAIGAENELALAYAGYGRLLAQHGDGVRARAYLTRALETFERLGTLREPDRVRQELTRLSDGSPPSS
jgi:tetratricopeptide (TPR) repeat protein